MCYAYLCFIGSLIKNREDKDSPEDLTTTEMESNEAIDLNELKTALERSYLSSAMSDIE